MRLYFSVKKSAIKKKYLYGSSRRQQATALRIESKYNLHQNKKYNSIPSANRLYPRPPTLLCGRADNACTNLLGFLVRYVRTRGTAKVAEDSKSANFAFILCRTYLPRMARATNSCTREELSKRWELTNARSALVNSPLEKAGKMPCPRQRTHLIHARQPYYAGVQAMRARICSAFSCAMFARVVRLRLRRIANLLTLPLSFAAHTCHALLLATNSCTREVFFKRGELTNARSALVGVAETGGKSPLK